MNIFLRFFEIIPRLGWLVMTPVFLALTGRGMGMRLGSAFRCGLRVTGALFGLNLMVNSLGSSLSGLTSDIAAAHNLAMDVTDVGWGASSAIASASTIASWMIPLYLAVNWVMFLTRSTRTVNLDLWNLWHVTFMGAMVERLTDSLAYGMVATAALSVVLLVFSDRCGWRLARQCQLTGVSIAGGFGTAAIPFALGTEYLLNCIPGRPRLVLDRSTEPREVLASPAAWSVALGVLLGVLAGRDGYAIAQQAVTFGAIAFLAPYLGQALSTSFLPFSEAITVFSKEKLQLKGNIYLGLSPTCTLGSGTVIVVTLMVAPIITLMAGSIPGNRMMLQGDIVMLPYIIAVVVMVCRGDLVRSLLAGVLASSLMLWCSSSLSELFTIAAVTANAPAYETLGTIANFSNGGNPLVWLAVQAGSYGFAGMALLVVAAVTLAVWNHNRITSGADVAAQKKRVRRRGPAEAAAEGQPQAAEPPADSAAPAAAEPQAAQSGEEAPK